MNPVPSQKIEDGRIAGPTGSNNGACIFKKGSANIRCIFSDGGGWDHVSVSLPTRCPTWEEMDWVKRVFFKDDEIVMQLHVSGPNKINHHPFCLHLWRPQSPEECEAIAGEWKKSGDEPMECREFVSIPLPPIVFV